MITQPLNNKNAVTLNQNIQEERETSLRRCQEIAKSIEGKIEQEIINGQVKMRNKPLHIQSSNDLNPLIQNPERSIRDKISSLSSDLEMLHKQIAMQKEKQRERQEYKKREASVLIQRLKRQKQEHRNKLRFNQMSSRLKSSVLSEDVLKLMRERRESLVLQKKKDMQLRIYQIINRRVQREEDQNKNQVKYWTKIKQIQDKKRHQSTKLLPSIQKANEEPQFGINLLQRKNSNFSQKRSFSKQDLTIEYHDVVNKFLQRAKAKQSDSKSQQSPNYKSRIIPSQVISQKNQSQLPNSKVSAVKNQRIQKIVASFIQDKRKVLGNEYLKQSLLKVDRAKSPRASTIMDYSFAQESLQLRGNPAIFHKNDKVSYLEDRRQKILQSFMNNKLEKSMAIQMLGPVQLRLDRINPEGIQKRLKEKLQLFGAQKKNETDQKYKVVTQFEQSQRRI